MRIIEPRQDTLRSCDRIWMSGNFIHYFYQFFLFFSFFLVSERKISKHQIQNVEQCPAIQSQTFSWDVVLIKYSQNEMIVCIYTLSILFRDPGESQPLPVPSEFL